MLNAPLVSSWSVVICRIHYLNGVTHFKVVINANRNREKIKNISSFYIEILDLSIFLKSEKVN